MVMSKVKTYDGTNEEYIWKVDWFNVLLNVVQWHIIA